MSTQNLSLFKAMGAKMDYLNQRQRVISQNIANADTPGYRPQDLVPESFNNVLKDLVNHNKMNVDVVATDSKHMPTPGDVPSARSRKQRETYEVAPAGNAVIMEEQLINAGRTVMDYNLMTNLYQKHISMIKTSLGRGQQ